MRPLALPLLALLILGAPAAPAAAQSLFAPVARVGDRVVTGYELDQRIALNRALNAPGDLAALSLEQLVEDRLRLIAAERNGVAPSEEEVVEGMAEFAGRADLTLEAFLAGLAQAGVEAETLRDFVRAGVAYRLVVLDRFGPRAGVTEADIDKALARVAPPGALEASLSEIILPADTPEREAQSLALAAQVRGLASVEAFADAARQISFAASRDAGGRLDPIPLDRLPGPIQDQLRRLRPGGVTEPIRLPDAIVIFQLRGLRETGTAPQPPQAIDYAAFYIPGGRSPEALGEAAVVRAAVDSCDDLYGIAQGLPPERLERGTRRVDAIPADVAAQLALLDPGEASVALTRSGGRTLVFLMLCARDPLPQEAAAPAAGGGGGGDDDAPQAVAGPPEPPSLPVREAVRADLRNDRLVSYADAYLDELRAEAGVEILARP